MVDNLINNEDNKLLKQRLQRVHQATGISLALIIYIMLFFGVFAILLPYINPWAKPSNHIAIADSTKIEYEKFINPILVDKEYPNKDIEILLPDGGMGGFKGDRTLRIRVPFVEDKIFNPNSYQEIKNNDLRVKFAWFLNQMHYGYPLGEYSFYFFGLTAVGGMFLIIGGIILVLKIKYKNSDKTPTSKFSKYHRKLFIWVSLPFFIILISGAIINLGWRVPFSIPMTYLVTKGESISEDRLTTPIFFPKDSSVELKNEKVKMLPINELLIKAKEINPNIDFKSIRLINWSDLSGIVKFIGVDYTKPFISGNINNPSITLNGVDGSIVAEDKVFDASWTRIFRNALFYLHLLFGVNDYLRIFMAFIMGLCAIAVGFGVLLYLEKKARRFQEKVPVYQGFGKVALAVMIGVIPAVSVYFATHWVLPFEMEYRFELQKMIFTLTWCATLTWSFYRINSYQASKEFLYFGGILFALTPIFHFIKVGFSPIELYSSDMGKILAVDIGLFIFGLILIFIAYKLPTNREKIKEFWTARGVK